MSQYFEDTVLGDLSFTATLICDGPDDAPPGYLQGFVDDYLRWSFDCGEPVLVTQIVAALGLSRYCFGRAFREECGMSPLVYIREKQLERIRELLATTDLTIDRVAMLSGCGSTRALYRLFEGEPMSPAAWRDAHRQ